MGDPLYRTAGEGRGTLRETVRGSAPPTTTAPTLTTTETNHGTDMMRGTAIRPGITTGDVDIRGGSKQLSDNTQVKLNSTIY